MSRSLAVFVAVFILTAATASAQGRGGGRGGGAADAPRVLGPAPPLPQQPRGFVQPKTPWGDPDIQGFWPSVDMVGVPLQRPARFGTRNVLTDAEFAQRAQDIKDEEASLLAEIDVFTAEINPNCAIRCPTSPQPHWQETGKPSRQASLIVDPPDGRQPPLSAEGQSRQAEQQAAARAQRERLQGREADTYLDRSLYDRCITRGVLGSILPVIYNNGNEIVQGPGYVVIRNEMIHEARVVPLDNRPHVSESLESYMGDSRGHWDGNTLVVVTTRLNGMTAVGGNGGGRTSDRITITERFTMMDADTLQYTATIDDPGTWTQPWTLTFPWKREPVYGMFEYACHEGNYAMRHILSNSRAAEKAVSTK
ncbi:MAG TPA: hypothetical protein VFV95_00510 [Vicinamibacterales bacterium]|nr:hypothetical protein [Vicinamibacterales bacterium]